MNLSIVATYANERQTAYAATRLGPRLSLACYISYLISCFDSADMMPDVGRARFEWMMTKAPLRRASD